MYIIEIPVTTTGSSGSATGNATYSPPNSAAIQGIITGIGIDYHASAPNTTVVRIEEVGGLGRTIVTMPAGNTDKYIVPGLTMQNATGADISGAVAPFATWATGIKVTVTLSNALSNAVVVRVQVA